MVHLAITVAPTLFDMQSSSQNSSIAHFSTMADDGDNNNLLPQIYVVLVTVASAVLVFAIYHWAAATCCQRRHGGGGPQQRPIIVFRQGGETPSSIESSMAQLIPAHKYQKGSGPVGEDCTCPVCLCEFEDGEEIRTLPECMHSYHVPCIDMWLYSHSSCPMCRTDATPSRNIFRHLSDFNSGNT